MSEKWCLSYPTIPFITIVTQELYTDTETSHSQWSSMPFMAVWNFALHPGSNQAVQIAFGGHVPSASFSQEQCPWVSLLFMKLSVFESSYQLSFGLSQYLNSFIAISPDWNDKVLVRTFLGEAVHFVGNPWRENTCSICGETEFFELNVCLPLLLYSYIKTPIPMWWHLRVWLLESNGERREEHSW
jgi:hypothetical protein